MVTRRHLRLLVHENGAACLEIADDMDVVDDLLSDVDGRAIVLERPLDGLDGALDTGAVPAGRCEEETLDHADRVSAAVRPPVFDAGQRAVSASTIPTRTTTPPRICTATRLSPSQAQATTAAATGSKWRRCRLSSREGAAAPRSRARTARSFPVSRSRPPVPTRGRCRHRAAARHRCSAPRTESSTTAARPPTRATRSQSETDDRDRVSTDDEPLAHQVVDRQRDRRQQPCGDAQPVQREP